MTTSGWLLLLFVVLFAGILLGSTFTIQATQPELRRQAEERRRLNEEWAALRSARRQDQEPSDGDLHGGDLDGIILD